MKISSDSKIIQYAYWQSDYIPYRTTLCKLFWRLVGRTVLYTVPFWFTGMYIWSWIWEKDHAFAAVVTILAALLAFAIGLGWTNEEYIQPWRRRRMLEDRPPSLISEAFWGIKNKVCPTIYIEDEQD